MNILVTGGAGYIGSHIVEECVKRGHGVIVYDNLYRGHLASIHHKAEFERIDIVYTRTMPRDIDAVIHAAALAYVGESSENPLMYYEVNVSGTIAVLSAMQGRGVERMVFCSSCTASGESSPYGRTKAIGEQIIRDAADTGILDAAIVRYCNVGGASDSGNMGEDHDPETHLIPLCLKAAMNETPMVIDGNDYPTSDGTCVRDYVHVSDVARITVDAVDKASPACPVEMVGTGVGSSVLDVIAECERVAGKKIDYSFGPRRPGNEASLIATSGLRSRYAFRNLHEIVESAYRWMKQHEQGYGE